MFGRVEKASVWLVCKLDLRQAVTKNGEFRASGAGELRPQKLTKVRGHRIMDSEASLEAGVLELPKLNISGTLPRILT